MSAAIDIGMTLCLALIALYAVWRVVSCAFRRSRGGVLIVNASRPRKRMLLVFAMGLLALFFAALAIERKINYDVVLTAIVLASSWYTVTVVELRKRGIFTGGYLIPWDRILAWRWENTAQQANPSDDFEVVDAFAATPKILPAKSEDYEAAVLRLELLRGLRFWRSFRIRIARGAVNDVAKVMRAQTTGRDPKQAH
jgi:hypothetical protein